MWWLIVLVPALEEIAEQGGEAGEIARVALADAAIMPLERELLRRYELDWIEQGAT